MAQVHDFHLELAKRGRSAPALSVGDRVRSLRDGAEGTVTGIGTVGNCGRPLMVVITLDGGIRLNAPTFTVARINQLEA